MNNSSSLQELANGLASLLSVNILPAIAKGIKDTKGVDVTIEELLKWCNFPITRSLLPATGFGGAVPVHTPTTTATTAAKGKAGVKAGAKAPVEVKLNQDGTPQTSSGKPFVEGKVCRHFYEKGTVNGGKYCGKDVVKGTMYCNNKGHKDKENKETKQKVNPGVAPSVETVQQDQDDGTLKVKPYDVERELFVDINHNFIVKEDENVEGVIWCFGKLYPDNTIKPLSDNDMIIAKAMELSFPDADDNNVITQPKVSVVESKPVNVPQMPMSVPVNVPQMPMSVPQMPMSVSQMPMSVPQMPMNVPQMPMSVPQMPMPMSVPQNVPQMPMPMNVPQGVPQMPMSVPQMPRSVPQFPGSVPK